MKSPLTKEQRAELFESGTGWSTVARELLDSHALVDSERDLATAKLATAKVCEKCKGTGCRFGYWHDKACHTCLHCVNGVQFSDERARELLERLKRAEWLISEGASIQTDGKQFWVRWEFKENGMSGPPRESIDEAIRAAQNKL